MAYVYRHIRLDTNMPFYIGAAISENDTSYKRAHCNDGRNAGWKNVVKNCNYFVEIIMDELSSDEALNKEMEFIKLYGREEFGGTLVNLTNGGKSNGGYVLSKERRKAHSEIMKGRESWMKGKKHSAEAIEKNRKAHIGQNPWNKGIPTTEEAKRKNSESCKGRVAWNKGIPSTEEAKQKMIATKKAQNKIPWNKGVNVPESEKQKIANRARRKPVIQLTMDGGEVERFSSIYEAAEKFGIKAKNIGLVCSGNYGATHYNGFRWQYF